MGCWTWTKSDNRAVEGCSISPAAMGYELAGTQKDELHAKCLLSGCDHVCGAGLLAPLPKFQVEGQGGRRLRKGPVGVQLMPKAALVPVPTRGGRCGGTCVRLRFTSQLRWPSICAARGARMHRPPVSSPGVGRTPLLADVTQRGARGVMSCPRLAFVTPGCDVLEHRQCHTCRVAYRG